MDKYDRAFNADWDEYKQLRTFIGDRYNGFIDLLKEKYHIEIPENLQGDYPQPSDLGLFIADKYGLSKDKDEDYNRLYGMRFLAKIGKDLKEDEKEDETAFWTREKYANNFLAILKYLEKTDGLDVSEIRDMYSKEVERRKKDIETRGKDSFYARLEPWKIKDPDPSVETKLHKIVEKKFANLDEGEFANSKENIYHQTIKHYRVTALKAVLDEQKQMTQARSGYTK